MRRLSLMAVASLATITVAAQELRTGFERDVNLFRWTATALLATKAGNWDMDLRNRFVSDAFVQFDNSLRFRDENIFRLNAGRPLQRNLSVHLRGQMDWFGLSHAFSQSVSGGLRVTPFADTFVEPFLGAAADRRPGVQLLDGTLPQRLDVGPAFGVRLGAQRSTPEGYQLSLGGEAQWQQISPRRGRAMEFAGGARRQFGSTQLQAEVRVASLRRDTYQSASFLNRNVTRSETIEATVSDTLDAALEIVVPLYGALRLLAQADLRANQRRIRTYRAPEETLFFDTDFNRRALDAEIGLVYDTRNLAAQLLVLTTAASEQRRLANEAALPPSEAAQKTNLLLQADYDEGIWGLRGSLRATVLPRLALAFNGNSRIVRHDTHKANPDDRDEVYHQGEIGVQWQASPYTQAELRLFGSWYQTVYLKAARSAENNVQRSLRLRPGLRWEPSRHTRVRLTAEVRATYTVDDFVLAGRRPTDQSAREMRIEAEAEQRLWQDAILKGSGSFADLRLSRLLWDSFEEIPFDTLRTYNAWIQVGLGRRLRTEIGWRLYMRSDYDRTATVWYARVGPDGKVDRDETGRARQASISRPGRRWIRQIGPTGAIYWQKGVSSLRLEAWANIQRVYHRLYGDLPELSAARIRAAARRGTRRLIPMVTLSVVWSI